MTITIGGIVLAAGRGTRMRSSLPKVLHPLAHRPMIHHVLDCLQATLVNPIVIVLGDQADIVRSEVDQWPIAIQDPQQGTAHAVQCAEALFQQTCAQQKNPDFVLIVYGDTPLLRSETITALIKAQHDAKADLVIAGFTQEPPHAYGRLMMNSSGDVTRIVEAKDATATELAINLCNAGILLVRQALLWDVLPTIDCNNQKKEYYLTDLVQKAYEKGCKTTVAVVETTDVMGINNQQELAEAEHVMQQRLRAKAMLEFGVRMMAPETVFMAYDTQFGRDVVIDPYVTFGPGVTVADGVHISAFSALEGATIGDHAKIGPFARLRPGTDLGPDVRIGNFVEVKKSSFGPGAKANHLSYIGDATIGAHVNIGAGTITCNYDGFAKHETYLGDGCFIGSNTALVAPVKVGAGAIVAAGSVITKDVEDDALALSRSDQTTKPLWAAQFRKLKKIRKG